MSPNRSADRQWQQWLWLLIWTLLGAGLRFANLEGKPPWADEFRTLVLTVGNSFKSVPLNRVIDIQTLLAPLIPHPQVVLSKIIERVSIEDRQPPIYFGLAALWMQLFPPHGGLVSLWGARALPALIGTLTIPCGYIWSYLTFGTRPEDAPTARSIANFTAAMLAVSPYGVFIAQEARHYSLASLWTIVSINCLAIACRHLVSRQNLPLWPIAVWVSANILGMGTHYLFGIALIAQAITLGIVWRWQAHQAQLPNAALARRRVPPTWRRLAVAISTTTAGAAFWLWLFVANVDRTVPGWIDNPPHKLIEVFNPFFQILGAAISMLSLLLVEVTELPPITTLSDSPIDLNIPIVILSAILMLIFFVWVTPLLDRGVRSQWRQPQFQVETIAILWFTASALGLYLTLPWLTGIDITRGARYHFVYFPSLMMLLGLGLASCWRSKPSLAKWVSGKQAVTIVILMGVISSAIVASNYGYHKYYRPEQIVPIIGQSAPIPVLIATTHNSLIQVGEMMGLAWEMQHPEWQQLAAKTQFLLARQAQKFCERDCAATKLLGEIIARQSRSIDLWLINFNAPSNLPPTCVRSKQFTRGVYGYQYQLYHCRPPLNDATS
ncbi:hypothetical protein [Chamaesiphon sp. OTE_8_metabat_110]|uniref:glycosyltransferase family 39 protein n=1 Tax=Chamaesiphon sp. OTE_8_metabat_110 TaxID=2964696 RepID=UPI00286AC2E0|nr:hypothetical protein [Chamaesiphon sp. OTE_8_metabat_110]